MTKKPALSTHILDLALGLPATGVSVALDYQEGSEWNPQGKAQTNSEGRIPDLLAADTPLKDGIYRLTFHTEEYFHKTKRTCFFPIVSIVFQVTDAQSHYHIPLLLSPYGYSTYRGT